MKAMRHSIVKLGLVAVLSLWPGDGSVEGAELSVGNVTMLAGDTADVVVSGVVTNEGTFGVTILVEIVPRAGTTGTVTFTASPPVDIVQTGDPWPGAGLFSPFDTDSPGFSSTLNGAVDDDGVYLCSATVNFSGAMVSFPVAASLDADGVWDVVLSTSAGDSNWECLGTTLIAGTITVTQAECLVDADCDDLVACTDDTCQSGSCVFAPNDANCDDGLFCTGTETCDPVAGCQTGTPVNCDDGIPCTDDSCNESTDSCDNIPNNANCDDGLFCTGTETCDPLVGCVSTGDPCQQGEICDEPNDMCVNCTTGSECDDGDVCTDDVCNAGLCEHINNTAPCDDGLFCTLTDTCSGGVCVGGGDPCPGQLCDEAADVCLPPAASLTVNDLTLDRGQTAELLVSGAIAGDSTFGVTILVEIIPRAGSVGSVVFTPSPPVDVVQRGDPWPLAGMFSPFDTDAIGFSDTLNASVDDNGTFLSEPLTYVGPLTGFPVIASSDAGGVWDVVLSTSSGDSSWEGVPTTLNAGTISVTPSASLSVSSRAMPPGSTVNVVVSGEIDGESPASVDILLEIVPRAGAVGTLEFTAAPDILELNNPWGAAGTFSAFDVGSPGFSATLNGSVHGTFTPVPLTFSNTLSAFPVQASAGADGVWDLVLSTSAGDSGWEGVLTALTDGTITVASGACVTDIDCDDANTCTTDTCNAGVCEYATVVGACDDGDLCTVNDTCQGTVCTGTVVDCSSLDDACNLGTCNPVTGLCEPTPANEGGACDDSDPCTESDSCTGGVCGGTPVDCSSLDDACNVGTCNPATGVCEPTPANEGGSCDDGDLCTLNDTCFSGNCGGTAIDCSALTDDCNIGACDPLTGACIPVTVNEGGPCDDADVCTLNDVCTLGVCGGTPVDCSGLNDACNFGTCNPTSGICEAVPTNEGGPCDDGDPCTDTDTCATGACAGNPIPGCLNCSIDADCDDGNFCTQDSCIGGACQYTDLTVPCDDGNLCTVNDVCAAGACTGTPVDCSALNDTCNIGVCSPSNGSCQAQPANEGGTCDDGLPCTTGDVCSGGTCAGTLIDPPVVNLSWSPASQTVQVGQPILIDLVATSNTCVDLPVGAVETILNWNPALVSLAGKTDTGPIPWLISAFPDDSGVDGLNAPFTGVPANDGDALYEALSGFPSGASVPPAGVVITTFEFLALDGTTGTSITIPPAAGSFTLSRVLGADQYLGMDITGNLGSASVTITECQTSADCDDGNVCTFDVCSSGVCQNNNNTAPCEDGLFCTTNDTCSGGVCVGGGDPCTSPLLCSESLNACVECLSSADCADGNICTDDVCDAFGVCSNPNNTAPCDDGLFCTATDTCSGGVCVGGGDACPGAVCDEPNDRCVECLSVSDCDDANVCTDDACVANVCEHVPNSLPCDDGLYCTVVDSCVGGACVGSGNPCTAPLICSETLDACVECEVNADCDDGNVCTTDVCFFNTCSNTNNTAPCDDGLFCTTTDTCSGGVCVGSGDACPGQLCDEPQDRCVDCFTVADCPDDGLVCTVDTCLDGACVYTPTDALCDDGLFCNGPEFCHTTLDCQPASSPCDDPGLCDEVNDSCGCQEPVVVAEGCRFISVTPRPGSTPVALLVTGVDAGVACISLYVQSDGTLGPTPVYKPPTGPTGWGTAHVRGVEIIPNTTYIVQAECDTGQGIGLSTPAQATTWGWGDTDNSGGLVDVLDITWVADGFGGVFNMATLYGVDLWGPSADDCRPQLAVDVFDLTYIVEAFQQFPFSCGDPCP